jgi:hypothetical protein
MTDENKPDPPKKGPVFTKPKEPQATPSKSAPKPLAAPERPPLPTPKASPAVADSTAQPQRRGAELAATERPRSSSPAEPMQPIIVPAGRAEIVVDTTGLRAPAPPKPRAAFVEASLAALDTLDCDSLAICICSDVRPLAGIAGFVDWRMCGRLSELIRRGILTGASREKLLMPYPGRSGPTRVFVLGWGPQKSILDGATERLAWMVDLLLRAKVESVAIGLPEPAVALLGLIDEHVRKPLGDKCAVIFAPDQLLVDGRTISPAPVPMPPPLA